MTSISGLGIGSCADVMSTSRDIWFGRVSWPRYPGVVGGGEVPIYFPGHNTAPILPPLPRAQTTPEVVRAGQGGLKNRVVPSPERAWPAARRG